MTSSHPSADLFRALNPTQDGLIELRAIPRGSGRPQQEFIPATEPERAAARALELPNGYNVYFGVAPRSRAEGTKDAVLHVPSVWADVDGDAALGSVERFPLAPTAIVKSGSGIHAYWVLEKAIEPAHAESLLRRLSVALGSDRRVTDAGHVLRPLSVGRLSAAAFALLVRLRTRPQPRLEAPTAVAGRRS